LLLITAPRCKAAGLAFIGARRRALAEEADGPGAGFSQEGHLGLLAKSSMYSQIQSFAIKIVLIGIALRHDLIA
jgi:hypothetical protein